MLYNMSEGPFALGLGSSTLASWLLPISACVEEGRELGRKPDVGAFAWARFRL